MIPLYRLISGLLISNMLLLAACGTAQPQSFTIAVINLSEGAHGALEGAAPADLPVETAEFFLGINLKTARAIAIEVPDDIREQANEIFR